MKIAYLSNRFPCRGEPYVMEEIEGLRQRGIEVLASSARRAGSVPPELNRWSDNTLYLQSLRVGPFLRSLAQCLRSIRVLRPFLYRVLSGNETLSQRAKALVHTWLGVYYAVLLRDENVRHIHVHHGYFAAWIAMVAAHFLGITYSVTLHGSDLLLNAAYMDIKLERCAICFTVSEYNREFLCRHYPRVPPEKVMIRRLGVTVPPLSGRKYNENGQGHRFLVLAAGRLHPVKNHSFLVTACALLKARGLDFVCFIAGDGPERKKLEKQIHELSLQREVKLLGDVAHDDLEAIYSPVDLVVLTSKSEGIPLVLMEAMAHGVPVLAPNITGIPELVVDGRTGFLYPEGDLGQFLSRMELVLDTLTALGPLRRAAREHVNTHFNRAANLQEFIEDLVNRLSWEAIHADPLLQ